MPAAWANQHAWRILETSHANGLNFLATWSAWRADPQRPRSLHYVAITASAANVPDANALEALAQTQSDGAALAPLARLLSDQCFGLLPGFQRLEFEQGQVLLTFCIGDLKAMLREQRFAADSIFLVNPDSPPES